MATRDLGQNNCPHKEEKLETIIHHDESGEEVTLDGYVSVFDRRFCANPNCNKQLGDTNLRWEPIPIGCPS